MKKLIILLMLGNLIGWLAFGIQVIYNNQNACKLCSEQGEIK